MEKIRNSNSKNTRQSGSARYRATPVGSAVIAAICIIIYLTALVQATVRLYLSIENNRTTAEQEFNEIAALASSTGAQGFMDQRFIDVINNALSSSRSIEAIIITGPDHAHAFEKQRGHAVIWVNNAPQFVNRLSLSNINYFRPLQIPNVRNANIKAAANAVDFNELIDILRDSLLIIFIGFALAFFTLLFHLLTKRQTESVYPGSPDLESHFSNETEMELPKIGPKGLFSPRSNIGWEEYTKDRLESEIHRCASTENDLAFIIVEFNDLTNDSMFRQSAEEAVMSFSSRDLIFEDGRWGMSVILPGFSLESAISKSEYFYQRIMGKFPRGYKKESSVYIGLTSRAGRLINASRMILEAREALKKAKTDPKASIIAFKSDPDKYRDFINSRN